MINKSKWAIEVNNLSKSFNLTKPRSIFELHKKRRDKTFWALKDLNLKIPYGQCLGIIGSNGAGKSTLLKIISKILKPTKGYIKINGRVNSLLEVGTGFEKELSGRKNIFLNSSILGMSSEETEKVYNDIVEFSGVKEFIDIPVKYYSSGMYSRLAFSIAAFSKSEILLIDEVLSVGDLSFKEKSFNKMTDLMFSETKTVIFVSHGLSSISKLCDQVVWLEKGKMQVDPFGRVWPCCYFSLDIFGNLARREYLKDLQGFNDIHKNSLEKILSNSYWTDILPTKWKNKEYSRCNNCQGNTVV